jgi:uncharacterized protein (TIGR02246 family)
MATVKDEIKSANRNFMETFGRADAEGMGKLYTSSGQLLPTNSDFITGTADIRKFWQAVMDMGIKTAKLETVEVEEHGDTAFEVGRYSLGGDGGNELDKGKYVVIWKKEAGKWKLHRDIWNTSMPAS